MRKYLSAFFLLIVFFVLTGCNKDTNNEPITLSHHLMVYENSSITFDLSTITIDNDSEQLIYSISDVTDNGLLILEQSIVTYTPNHNFQGKDTFSYSVNDGEYTVANLITITIIQNNNTP